MNRREVLKGFVIGGAFIGIGNITKLGAFEIPTPKRGLTIDDIIFVSYPSVLNEMLGRKSWVSDELCQLEKDKRLFIRPLAAYVEVYQWDHKPNKLYDVEEVSIPMVWSEEDEELNPKEREKINLAACLLENRINSLDDIIAERIGNRRAVASKDYRYHLGNVTKYGRGNKRFYSRKLSTAIAIID